MMVKPKRELIGGMYRLSPNEITRLLDEEKKKRRIQRLKEVREQSRHQAARVREAVKQKDKQFIDKLVYEIKEEWQVEQEEKMSQLEQLYEESLRSIGQAHVEADILTQQNFPWQKRRQADHNAHIAQERHDDALRRSALERKIQEMEETKQIRARKCALDEEKERSARVAALPKPVVTDIDLDAVPRRKPVTFFDASTFSSTHYHMIEKDYAVDRADPAEQGDAKLSAADAEKRFTEIETDSRKRHLGEKEAAILRGNHALYMEHLRHDYDTLLSHLDQKQRADVNRRQLNVATIPKQIFQPPHRRLEDRQDHQRQLENAFQDVFLDIHGEDISLTLDPCERPPSASYDVTTESHLVPSNEETTSDSSANDLRDRVATPSERTQILKDIANDDTTANKPDKSLRSLMKKIKSQRDAWINDSQQLIPEKDLISISGRVSPTGKPLPDLPTGLDTQTEVEKSATTRPRPVAFDINVVPTSRTDSLPRVEGKGEDRRSPFRMKSHDKAERRTSPVIKSPDRHPLRATAHSPPIRQFAPTPRQPLVPELRVHVPVYEPEPLKEASKVRMSAAQQILSADKQLLQFEADRVREDLHNVMKSTEKPKPDTGSSHEALKEHAHDIEKKIRDLEARRQEILARESLIQSRSAKLKAAKEASDARKPATATGADLPPEHIRRIREYQKHLTSRTQFEYQAPMPTGHVPYQPRSYSQSSFNYPSSGEPTTGVRRPVVDGSRSPLQKSLLRDPSRVLTGEPKPRTTEELLNYKPRRLETSGYLPSSAQVISSHQPAYSPILPSAHNLSFQSQDSGDFRSLIDEDSTGYRSLPHESLPGYQPPRDDVSRPGLSHESLPGYQVHSSEPSWGAPSSSPLRFELGDRDSLPFDSFNVGSVPRHSPVLAHQLKPRSQGSSPADSQGTFDPMTSATLNLVSDELASSSKDSEPSFDLSLPLDLTTKRVRPSILDHDRKFVSPKRSERPSRSPESRTETLQSGISSLLVRANQQQASIQQLREDIHESPKDDDATVNEPDDIADQWQQRLLEWMKPLSTTPEEGATPVHSSKSSEDMELDERRLAELDSMLDESSPEPDYPKRRPPITKKMIYRDDITPHELSTIAEIDTPASDQSTLVPSVASTPSASPQKAIIIDDTFSSMHIRTPTRPETEGSDAYSPRPEGLVIVNVPPSGEDSFTTLRASEATRSTDTDRAEVTRQLSGTSGDERPSPVRLETLNARDSLPSPIMKNKSKAVIKEVLKRPVVQETLLSSEYRSRSSNSEQFSPLSQYSLSTDTDRTSLPQTYSEKNDVYSRLIAELAARSFGPDAQRPSSTSGSFRELRAEVSTNGSDPARFSTGNDRSVEDCTAVSRPSAVGSSDVHDLTRANHLSQYLMDSSSVDSSFQPRGNLSTWKDKLQPYKRTKSPDIGSSYLGQSALSTSLTWKDRLAPYHQVPTGTISEYSPDQLSQHQLDSDSPSTIVSVSTNTDRARQVTSPDTMLKSSPDVTRSRDDPTSFYDLPQYNTIGSETSDRKSLNGSDNLVSPPQDLSQYRFSSTSPDQSVHPSKSRDPVREISIHEIQQPNSRVATRELTQMRISSGDSSSPDNVTNLTDNEKQRSHHLRTPDITDRDISQHPLSSSALSSVEKRRSPLPPPIVDLTQYPMGTSSSEKTSSGEQELSKPTIEGFSEQAEMTRYTIGESRMPELQDITQHRFSDTTGQTDTMLSQGRLSDTVRTEDMKELSQYQMTDTLQTQDLTRNSSSSVEKRRSPLPPPVVDLSQYPMSTSSDEQELSKLTIEGLSGEAEMSQYPMNDRRITPDLQELTHHRFSDNTGQTDTMLSQGRLSDTVRTEDMKELSQYQMTDTLQTQDLNQNPLSDDRYSVYREIGLSTLESRNKHLTEDLLSDSRFTIDSTHNQFPPLCEELTQHSMTQSTRTGISTDLSRNLMSDTRDSTSSEQAQESTLGARANNLTQIPMSDSQYTVDSTQEQADQRQSELTQHRFAESTLDHESTATRTRNLTNLPFSESDTAFEITQSLANYSESETLTQVPINDSQTSTFDFTRVTKPTETMMQSLAGEFEELTPRDSQTPESDKSAKSTQNSEYDEDNTTPGGQLSQHRMSGFDGNTNNNNDSTSVWFSDACDIINPMTSHGKTLRIAGESLLPMTSSDSVTSDESSEDEVNRLVKESRQLRESIEKSTFASFHQISEDLGIEDEPDMSFASLISDSEPPTPKTSVEFTGIDFSGSALQEQTLGPTDRSNVVNQSESLLQSDFQLEDQSVSMLSFQGHEYNSITTPSASRLSVESKGSANTLAAAFAQRKAQFMKRSEKRVLDLKSKPRDVTKSVTSVQTCTGDVRATTSTSTSHCAVVSDVEKSTATSEDIVPEVKGWKVVEKEIHSRTNRLYSRLEEVKQKRHEDERKREYAANRDKAKEYQKKLMEQNKKKTEKKK